MSLQFDAVDANAFDSDTAAVDDDAALLLARVSTTPNRLVELFGVQLPKEGTWFEIELQKAQSMPRVLNATAMRLLPEDSELATRLDHACVATNAASLKSQTSLVEFLSLASRRDLKITALDVGHAACVVFSNGSIPFGYFDVGASMFFNQRSFPRHLDHQFATHGFVVLSHWDFDHFALAIRYPQLKQLHWFAPNQPVGPNTARFQRSLGPRLTFITGDVDADCMLLRQCTGTSPRDGNATGYAFRIDLEDAGILLPGDADYQWFPPVIACSTNRIMLPHHGAAGSPPPSPDGRANPVAVVSYGVPNTYRHPNQGQIDAHRRAGWRIRRTAAHGARARPRGNRGLYPI
jgi:hypothetical protein